MTLRSALPPERGGSGRAPLGQLARVLDLVTGVALGVISGATGLIILAFLQQLAGLSVPCEGVTPDGARCNPDYLNGVLAVGYGGVIFGWFVPIGFMIVRWVRRRIGFFLPLIAFAVMIAVFYGVTAALGSYQALS